MKEAKYFWFDMYDEVCKSEGCKCCGEGKKKKKTDNY
jgi:hypothetical protein